MDSDIDVDIDFSFRDKSSGGVFVLGVRKVVNYYGYGKHIAITNDPKVGVVFGGAFVYSINDVSPDTRGGHIRTGFEKWIEWEKGTKTFYEGIYQNSYRRKFSRKNCEL